MAQAPVVRQRWPVRLLAVSAILAIPLVSHALFEGGMMPHSLAAIAILLVVMGGAAVVAVWAVMCLAILITEPAERTFIGYFAVAFALGVASLVFAPSGLLR